MAIQQEFWKKQIEAAIYEANPFMNRARNADEYVIGGVAVHIPQSGGGGSIIRNPTYPLTVVQRTDGEVIYSLDKYSTQAMNVADMEAAELSYEKLASVKADMMGALEEFVGKDMLVKWAANVTGTEIINTTGAAAASTLPGATGTRKLLTEADIRAAAVMMDNMLVPEKGRVLILQPAMVDHLRNDNNLKYAFQQVVDLKEGSVGRLYGFDIYKKVTPVLRSAAGAIKLPETASAIDDNVAGVFYHENFVERAKGSINLYENPNRAEYQGTVVSFNVRMGGRAVRSDRKGLGLLLAAV